MIDIQVGKNFTIDNVDNFLSCCFISIQVGIDSTNYFDDFIEDIGYFNDLMSNVSLNNQEDTDCDCCLISNYLVNILEDS